MKDPIVVYVIRDVHHEDRRSKLVGLFKDDDFHVIIPDIGYDVTETPDNVYNRHEAYQVGWCLADAKENYPTQPVLIIKDSSLCVADPDTISEVVYSSLNAGGNFHICYLGRWNDKCHLHSKRKKIRGTMSHVAKTQSPHGVQALLFSVMGRDVVLGLKPMKNGKFFKARESISRTLNLNIVRGNLDAFCVVPNLIAYDISLAQEDEDYLKANECTTVLGFGNTNSNSINIYVAVLVIIILLILIVWAAISVSP